MMRLARHQVESIVRREVSRGTSTVTHHRGRLTRGCSTGSGIEAEGRRRLWRWGAVEGGGFVSKQEAVEISLQPMPVEEFPGVEAVACGSNHSAFVFQGRLHTYGSNKYSQLGREAVDGAAPGAGNEFGPVDFVAEDGHRPAVRSMALGAYHSAAITEGGALWTWGWGGSLWGAGALGQGSRQSRSTPTLVERFVEDGQEVRQVACGAQHTIVLTEDGRVYTTGLGEFGRLGRGETCDELDFEEVEYFSLSNDSVLFPHELTRIVKVDAGANWTAALSSNGELWVWGRNDYGQLGLGEEAMGDMYSASRYPRLVRALPLEGHCVADFACGEHHLVALTVGGAIYEWGSRMNLEPRPVSLPSRYEEGLKGIVKVAAGDRFSFALAGDGQLYSWGQKASGCLAHGQGPEVPKTLVVPKAVPPEVFGHQRVVDITASKYRCLAITQGERP